MSNKLSEYEAKKIILCFCGDLDATKTAHLLGINRNTAQPVFQPVPGGHLGRPSLPETKRSPGEFELD